MLNTYIPVQTMIWWLEHSIVVLWIVRNASSLHPFGSKRKNKIIIHVIFLAAAFLLPLVPIISAVSGSIMNYNNSESHFPSSYDGTTKNLISSGLGFQKIYICTLCQMADFTLSFYTYTWFLTVLQGIGTTFLILIFYQLWKVNFVNECLWFLHS